MNRVIAGALLLAALAATAAAAEITIEPVRGCAGHLRVDLAAGRSRWIETSPAPAALVETTVYDNLESPPIFGVVSSDLEAVWGDSITIAGPGILHEFTMTILNGASGGGILYSPQIAFTFRRAGSMQQMMTFHVAVVLPGGLQPGYYATVTIENLEVPPFVIDQTDLVVQQQIEDSFGTTSRLGVVSLSPPAIGTSPPSMYLSDGPGASPAGFYVLPGGPGDPGYRVRVEPTDGARTASWGRIKSLYR